MQAGHQRTGKHHVGSAVRFRLAQLESPVLGGAVGARQADLQFPGTSGSRAGVVHREREGLPQKGRMLLSSVHPDSGQDAAVRTDHILPSRMRVAGVSATVRVLLECAQLQRLVEGVGHAVNRQAG